MNIFLLLEKEDEMSMKCEIAVTGVEGMGNGKDKIRSKHIVEHHVDDLV